MSNPDALDYAQMGSELAAGHGFGTRQIFPMQVKWLAARDLLDAAPWPNVYRFPLPTLVYAVFFSFVADPVWAGLAQAGLFYVLTAPLIFVLGCRCAGWGAGVLALLLYLSDPLLLESGLNGMSEALALFLTVLTFVVALAAGGRAWRWVLVGAACGLAFLARTNLVFLAPLAALLALVEGWGSGGPKRAGLVFVGAVAVAAPWLVRNQMVAGEPLYSVATVYNLSAEAVPEPLIYRLDSPATTGGMLDEYGPEIAAKFRRQFLGNVLSPPFWAGLFAPRSDFYPANRESRSLCGLAWIALSVLGLVLGGRRVRIVCGGALLGLAVTFLLFCVVFHLPRFYAPLRPLLYVGASAAVFESCRRVLPQNWGALRYAPAALLALAMAIQGGFVHEAANRPRDPDTQHFPPVQPFDRLAFEAIAETVPEEAVIASDMSTEIAALSQRRTLRLPHSPEDLGRIDAEYMQIDWLVLGRRVLTWRQVYSGYGAWAGHAASAEFAGSHRLEGELPNGWRLYRRRAGLSDAVKGDL